MCHIKFEIDMVDSEENIWILSNFKMAVGRHLELFFITEQKELIDILNRKIRVKFKFNICNREEGIWFAIFCHFKMAVSRHFEIVVGTSKLLNKLIDNVNREVHGEFEVDISQNKEDTWLLLIHEGGRTPSWIWPTCPIHSSSPLRIWITYTLGHIRAKFQLSTPKKKRTSSYRALYRAGRATNINIPFSNVYKHININKNGVHLYPPWAETADFLAWVFEG